MKTAHLILKHKWFDLIEKGKKKVEYRKNTAYYRKRLFDANNVTLHRRYSNRTMTFEIELIVDSNPIEIYLGKRLE